MESCQRAAPAWRWRSRRLGDRPCRQAAWHQQSAWSICAAMPKRSRWSCRRRPRPLQFPQQFRQPFALSALGGTLAFWPQDGDWHIGVDALDFAGAGYAGQVRGEVVCRPGAAHRSWTCMRRSIMPTSPRRNCSGRPARCRPEPSTGWIARWSPASWTRHRCCARRSGRLAVPTQ